MKKIPLIRSFGWLVGLLAASAHASPVTVTNPSFELPAAPASPGYQNVNPTGWTKTGNAGVQLYTAMLPFAGATDTQAAWLGASVSINYASDLLTIAAGETYTLKVDAGSRSNYVSSSCTVALTDSTGAVLASSGVVNLADDDVMHEQTVTFTATAGHASIGNGLRIRLTNGSGSNQTVFDNVRLELASTPDPFIAFLTNPVTAGTVAVSTSGTAYVDVVNSGVNNTLTITGVTPVSGDTGKFTLVTNPLPAILPTELGTLEFTYAPGAAAGTHTAVFAVASNDPGQPSMNVTLTGTAISDPNLVSATALDFGTVVASAGSTSKTLNVSNSAFANDLNISLAITGTDAGKFLIIYPDPANLTVSPGVIEMLEIAYDPQGATGNHTATLAITHDDPDLPSPVLVTLTGTAIPRYEVKAQFRMGEDEAAGGALIGGTPAALIDATGAFSMTATGSPVLGNSAPAPSTPASTHHIGFPGGANYYGRTANILAASNASTNWIMEGWFNPAELSATDGFFLSDGHGGGGAILYQNGGRFGIGLGGNAFQTGPQIITPGRWYHVALVKDPSYNSGRATMFVNGVPYHSIASGGAASSAAAFSGIGAQGNGSAPWSGQADEVRYAKVYQFNPATDLHVTPPADADGDGLADAWEDRYFGDDDGLVTWAELVLTDGSGNFDNDGFTDKQEHDANTHPKDNTSFPGSGLFAIMSLAKAGNAATVQFQGIDGKTYVLKKSLTLSDGFPITVDSVTLSGTTTGTLQDTNATDAKAFYRVETTN